MMKARKNLKHEEFDDIVRLILPAADNPQVIFDSCNFFDA